MKKLSKAESRVLSLINEWDKDNGYFTARSFHQVNYRTLLSLEDKGYITGKFNSFYNERLYTAL